MPLPTKTAVTFTALVILGIVAEAALGHGDGHEHVGDVWCGLVVAPENRCSEYDKRSDYRYPRTIEPTIARRHGEQYTVDAEGRIATPWPSEYQEGVTFTSIRDTDIEHRVATAEAHDSGLCAASVTVRRAFARDLDNLTLAEPRLNRYAKSAKDPAEWLPERDPALYAIRWIHAKRQYSLTADSAEVAALRAALPPTVRRAYCGG